MSVGADDKARLKDVTRTANSSKDEGAPRTLFGGVLGAKRDPFDLSDILREISNVNCKGNRLMKFAKESSSIGPFAHTANSHDKWHDLREHLESVASLARQFAEPFEAGQWGYLAGLWHDLGKFSCEFQEYLLRQGSEDCQLRELKGKVDHTSAGAKQAVEKVEILGFLLAYAIAGHHAGLLDAVSDGACLDKRLSKELPEWRHGLDSLPSVELPELPRFLRISLGKDRKAAAFRLSFFVRMIFSCLLDADFLDTEAFMNPEIASSRPRWPQDILRCMRECLESFVEERFGDSQSPIEKVRAEVREACLKAALQQPGLFSLTVPTGGGKTLASLAFALSHAIKHGLKRIIYVVPFTSIIEQNAGVFREVMSPLSRVGIPDPVIEHHSTLDPGKETVASRLAAENWDAPLVVTTTVQFYESLFSNRPSRCRKLHNTVHSVIILDEVQKLPVDYLHPCIEALRELANNYSSTVLLCTATQPALHWRHDFSIGFQGVREILPDPPKIYVALKRVKVEDLGYLADKDLAERLAQHPQVLCIVNTRKHARGLFEKCQGLEGARHLSAAMCPSHRSETLRLVREALDRGKPCRVVATQVVEAGVDLDFPVVYRSVAGLDSIAQAAGRCNRNGKSPLGITYVFRSEHKDKEAFLVETSNAAEQILGGGAHRPLYEDPLSLDAVEHYFRLYFWSQKDRWDKHQLMDKVSLQNSEHMPFLFDFETISRRFRIIEDAGEPILIPWGEEGRRLCGELEFLSNNPPVSLMRALQRYTVHVPRRVWRNALGGVLRVVGGSWAVLSCLDPYYTEEVGLSLDVEEFHAEDLMV